LILTITLGIGLLLAYANGANDNFKGVATLFGSGSASYRAALLWATATTALGSVTALLLAGKLLVAFSGNGLVPAQTAALSNFSLAVALAAGCTVLLATRLSFPISTTHSLLGALVGAGWLISPSGVHMNTLANGFLLPLLTSPLIAIALTVAIYPLFAYLRRRSGVNYETCICVGNEVVHVVPGRHEAAQALVLAQLPSVSIAQGATCRIRYRGRFVGIGAGTLMDGAHFLTAGMVSFARGLNDTPKIAALLLVGGLLAPSNAIVAVGAAIAAGGWFGARRVAETLAHRITAMNPGQGFTANIITAGLVIGASSFGLPVSTTHVSCGTLFGIGAVTRQAHWKTISEIGLAWLITLPVAASLGAIFALLLGRWL
jgi:PiT family inorganic phosphate transporter